MLFISKMCKLKKLENMNCDLVGLLESSHFKNNKKMSGLIYLRGFQLSADEARRVVRAAVKAGYTDLHSVPDEFAENILKEVRNNN